MEVSYKLAADSSSNKSVKSMLTRALEDWNVVTAESIIRDPKHTLWIEEHGWELVPIICSHLIPHNEEAGPHLTACCQTLLTLLSERINNPKEVLMAFLEQLDQFSTILAVTRLLPGLGVTLLRIKEKTMGHSWSWALNTLCCHLRTVSVPDNSGLEGEERLVIDLGPEGREAALLTSSLLDFLSPLVDFVCDISRAQEEGDNVVRMTVLTKFLLNILGRPLSILSQHPQLSKTGQQMKPATWAIMSRIVELLFRMKPSILDLINHGDSTNVSKYDDEEPVDQSSVATLLYWLLGEKQGVERLPQVYTKLHLLEISCPHITLMLQQTEEMRIHKALLLLHSVLTSVTPCSVDTSDNPVLISLVIPLERVIVHHDVAELRHLGFSCYRLYLAIYNLEAKHGVFIHIINSVKHSGLLGWTVTQIKDALAQSLASATPSILYQGTHLRRLTESLYTLEQGPETDILNASDLIVSTINFTVFLLARDKEDTTQTRSMLGSKMIQWIEDLSKGLDLSTAHYKQRLVENPMVEQEIGFQVDVGGNKLPAMEQKQQEEVVMAALNTFDLLRFNLVRLKELMGI